MMPDTDVAVTALIKGDDDQVPELLGNVKQKFVEGRATFKNLKIGESQACTGMYLLCFEVPEIDPLQLEFFYHNSTNSRKPLLTPQQRKRL